MIVVGFSQWNPGRGVVCQEMGQSSTKIPKNLRKASQWRTKDRIADAIDQQLPPGRKRLIQEICGFQLIQENHRLSKEEWWCSFFSFISFPMVLSAIEKQDCKIWMPWYSLAISGTDSLEVPTICKAYFLGRNFNISRIHMAKTMVRLLRTFMYCLLFDSHGSE